MSASALVFQEPQIREADLTEMRSWVGRRMVLKRRHLQFEAGTRCQVMCVVDFGNELLLWVITDDQRSLDIDQLDLTTVKRLF